MKAEAAARCAGVAEGSPGPRAISLTAVLGVTRSRGDRERVVLQPAENGHRRWLIRTVPASWPSRPMLTIANSHLIGIVATPRVRGC